jgi:hypothetical protein
MGKMFSMDNMLKQNGGPVTIQSVLINKKDLELTVINAIRNATIVGAVAKAHELWGNGQSLTVRDLNGTDMAYAANIMTETSNAAANAWNAMAFGAFTVPTATVIGIYGVDLNARMDGTTLRIPITGIRFDVGGSRVAQWNVQVLDQNSIAGMTDSTMAQGGVTRAPIIVGEDITVTIYEYTRTATIVYDPVWLGVAVEKEGVTLKP